MRPSRDDRANEYFAKVRDRLDKGAGVYGDSSYSRDPLDLLREVREELYDVSGWAFVLEQRLLAMEERIRDAREEESLGPSAPYGPYPRDGGFGAFAGCVCKKCRD